MSTNHHTPITTGAPANASVVNAPLSQLDAAITAGIGGITLTNKSGVTLAANDCVVADSGNDEAVTTTTTAGDITRPGIVVAGGAADAEVTISLLGEVTVVVDGVGTRGQWIKTSTTAKQVTPTSTFEKGVFGILTSDSSGGAGTTATALLLGTVVGDVPSASDIAAGLLALARGGTGANLSATGGSSPDQYLKQAGVGAAISVGAIAAADLPSAIDAAKLADGSVSNTELQYLNGVTSAIQTQLAGKASTSHASDHNKDGPDAFTISDLLDAVARLIIKVSGTTIGARRALNLVPGNNVQFDISDDGDTDGVKVEVNAAGGSLGTDELTKVGAGGTADYLNPTDFEQDINNRIRVRRDVFVVAQSVPQNLLPNALDCQRAGWQRGIVFSSSTTPPNDDDTYLLDNIVHLSDGNNAFDLAQALTKDNPTLSPDRTAAHARFICLTADKQFGCAQFLDSLDSFKLHSTPVSFSFAARSNGISKLRAAIIYWTGTPDVITSDVVGTWAGNGTDPTLVSNWNYLNTPTDLALSSSWQTFKIENQTVPNASTIRNLGVFIWVDDTTIGIGDTLWLGALQLTVGEKAPAFVGRTEKQGFDAVSRYVVGFQNNRYICTGLINTSTQFLGMLHLPTATRLTVPSIEVVASEMRVDEGSASLTPSAVGVGANSDFHTVVLDATISGGTQGNAAILTGTSGGGKLIVTAEL